MSITLSTEDEQKLEQLVASGRFESTEAALQAALDTLMANEAWLSYAKERIAAGLEDIRQGRTISGEDFRKEILARRTKSA